jgi:hypothetical protein
LYSIHNPVETVSQAIGFLYCLGVSEFNFNASLQLQTSDELVEDLTLRKAVDLHCQGCEKGDVLKDRIILPEVCPLILEATVFVGGGGAKYCFMAARSVSQVNGVDVSQLS